jgi:pyruvate/2-oxoglutarate dehydrogenase complex dihydrolipoamide dehydrogenase (E3) component
MAERYSNLVVGGGMAGLPLALRAARHGRSGDLELIEEHGRFVAGRRLRVGDRTIEADRIFLNTGTRDTIPPVDGLDGIDYFTSRTILDLRQLPDHLVVVGGGYVGCEFAQMFARFGARVTVVQRAERLLPSEDPDVSAVVEAAFTDEGIDVCTATTCVAVAAADGRIRVACEGAGTDELTASHLLVAAGRTPNSDHLGLEHHDIEPDDRGFVPVDDRLHVGADGVWALGDLRGGAMFTHAARDDADTVHRNVFKRQDLSTAGRVVPHAVFVDPEVASVGLTEQAARDAGYAVAVGRQKFAGVAKAQAIGQTQGFIQFVADADTDRLLGCHIVGPDAGNLIHEAVIAMVADAPYGDIGRAIHIHPTLAEGVNAAAAGVHRPTA